ncbi:MAG: ABC transporter ATP-binding protein [Actinomycetota bacterium]
MPPLLRLRNVEARYGRFVALKNVALAVPEGSVVALLGPNGVGKTTLLRTVSGMLRPSRGEILFDGARIDGASDHAIARKGLTHIPEGRGIFVGLTVRENLAMAAFGGTTAGALERVYELFPILQRRQNQIAGTLSGGEQQMLSLARAVIRTPRLLMVDELSLGLAPKIVHELFDTLDEIRRLGTTILLVEQYVRYALRIADIVTILHKGSVAFIGEPGELARGALAAAYLGGSQATSAPTKEPPVAKLPARAPARKRQAPRSKAPGRTSSIKR